MKVSTRPSQAPVSPSPEPGDPQPSPHHARRVLTPLGPGCRPRFPCLDLLGVASAPSWAEPVPAPAVGWAPREQVRTGGHLPHLWAGQGAAAPASPWSQALSLAHGHLEKGPPLPRTVTLRALSRAWFDVRSRGQRLGH